MSQVLNLTADEKLARLNTKVEWAKQHFFKLQEISERFLNTKPYAIGTDSESKRGRAILYLLKDAELPPTEIGLLAGDIVHNLRSTLDHLAYDLWVVGTKGQGFPARKKPFGKACFPIADGADDYKTSSTGKVEGMTDKAKELIAYTEPYQGGKGELLWLLHELDIADKHHTLVTADIRAVGLNMKPLKAPSPRVLPTVPYVSTYRFNAWDFVGFRAPAKAGYEVASFDTDIYKYVEPTFDIPFSESEIIEGESVSVVLKYLIGAVEGLLPQFRYLLV